jgi:hypothetical protein
MSALPDAVQVNTEVFDKLRAIRLRNSGSKTEKLDRSRRVCVPVISDPIVWVARRELGTEPATVDAPLTETTVCTPPARPLR